MIVGISFYFPMTSLQHFSNPSQEFLLGMAFLVDSSVPLLVQTSAIFVVLHPWLGKAMSKRFRAWGDRRYQGCVVSSSGTFEENVLFLCLHRVVFNSFPSFWSSKSWGFCQTTLHFCNRGAPLPIYHKLLYLLRQNPIKTTLIRHPMLLQWQDSSLLCSLGQTDFFYRRCSPLAAGFTSGQFHSAF